MTIGLGLVGNDGLVLCADMQRTISGYTKTFDGKVGTHIFHNPRVVLSIAGAGDEDYIETAKQILLADFPEELEKRSDQIHENIPVVLKERFLNFFDEHLARWVESERPSVELLIGVTGKDLCPRLFHCNGTAFHQVHQKAIGSGVLVADQLLLEYVHHHDYKVAELASLAVYILRRVKNGVDGCGGETHGVVLRKGYDFAFIDKMEALEKKFAETDAETKKSVIQAICENRPPLQWMSEHKTKMKGQITQ